MIIVVDGVNAPSFTQLVEQTYALRARVFQDRLGWDVNVENGKETDIFDTLNPTTLISVDETGTVLGSMRILQTTGPNMLADVFYDILQGEAAPRSPQIWEATRLCVDTDLLRGGPRSAKSINYVTSEIMIAACMYAMDAGVTDAVAVIDPLMNRVLKRSGNAPYDYLGKPTPMGKVTAMAGLLDCSHERIVSVRKSSGITGDVILGEDEALSRFGDAALNETGRGRQIEFDTLRAYCSEQLSAARTEDERKAVLKLIAELEKDKAIPLSEKAITHASI